MDNQHTERQTTDRREFLKRGLRHAFLVFLALRVGTVAWMILLSLSSGRSIGEPNVLCKSRELLETDLQLGAILRPWLRWDTLCYLQIAETGYAAHPELTVWPPLYPLLIRLFSFVFMPPVLAALIVSSLAAWLALFLLYVLVAEHHGETTARNTLFLYAIYPVAFFLVAGYTESLFLALAVGSLLLAQKKSWGWAGILAALATLTRNQGIVLSLALLWEGMLSYRKEDGFPANGRFKILLASALPVIAFAGFALYVREGLGASWPWQTLVTVWGQSTGFPWEGMIGNVKQMLTLPASQDLYWLPTTVLDLVLVILVPVLLIRQRNFIRPTHLIFAWSIFLIASMKLGPNDTLVSFSRYMLAAFPFFVALSPLVINRYARLAVFGICLILQAIFLSMFYIWSWAG